jgi:LPS sulfotransferase NodH
MSVLAYGSYLVIQIRRAAAIRNGSFEDGLWGQRIEQISFAALPQNLVILTPAVAAAVAGALLVRSLVAPVVVHIGRLVRVVAGLSFVVVAIAVVGIVAVFFRRYDSVGDTAAVLGRLGGIAMAAAMIRLCLEADHET